MLMKSTNLQEYYTREQISSQFDTDTWQRKVYSELDMALSSENRPFPCLFGVAGHKADQIRYAFAQQITPESIAAALSAYLPKSRGFGPNTSLVLFEAPSALQTMDAYFQRFWELLRDVTKVDATPWPENVPEETNAPMWEFCFAGEPVFVVCTTPAHIMRQSRRSTGFMLTFQPRWVFDRLLGTEKAAEKSFSAVRSRLKNYDFIAQSPALGKYGAEGIREAEQYFLTDGNTPMACPFHKLKD